jgi:hypothetical protein
MNRWNPVTGGGRKTPLARLVTYLLILAVRFCSFSDRQAGVFGRQAGVVTLGPVQPDSGKPLDRRVGSEGHSSYPMGPCFLRPQLRPLPHSWDLRSLFIGSFPRTLRRPVCRLAKRALK